MNQINLSFDYDKYPTLKKAALSDAIVTIIIGPAGSAKTSWCAMEILRLATMQEPAADGVRYSRALVIRNTYQLLTSNTVETFKNMYGPLYNGTGGNQPKAAIRFRLPDGTSVCLDVLYLAMDDEESQSKLLGAEPTFVLLDEVSELPESLVFAVVQRLGRYPSGARGKVTRTRVLGATNGPIKGHWLHKWFLGERQAEMDKVAALIGVSKFAEVLKQPPALLRPSDPNGEWLPNPAAENIHNLAQGYGYYFSMLANPDNAKIQAYVEGDFADIRRGKPVFPEFSREVHTFDASAIPTQSLRTYMLAFDFGRTPTCLLGFLSADGALVILDEFMGDNMSVEQLYKTIVLPNIKERYPYAVCSHAFGDPAGTVGGQGLELSPFDTLRNLGVPIVAPVSNNKLEPRLGAVRVFLTRLGYNGKPMLRISNRCGFLVQALVADYIYEMVRGSNTLVKEEPTKSHTNWVSDLCDALQYMALGALRMDSGDTKPTRAARVDWYS